MAAADHLARWGQRVWILTGFYIPKGTPSAAETDGPPGAAFLARALQLSGIDVSLITDRRCAATVRAAAKAYGLDPGCVLIGPDSADAVAGWTSTAVTETSARPLTHLVSVERVGPAQTPATWSDVVLAEQFRAEVAEADWNCCHNMRGERIDDFTAPLHGVVEWIARHRPGVRTIGIGDGGNEIGMGALPYRELRRRLAEPVAACLPCRIPTDWTILAGVSNWGAMALAAGVCWKLGTLAVLHSCDAAQETARLQTIVRDGPAVDGVTRQQQATVDGLSLSEYLEPWQTLRAQLGWQDFA